MRPLSIVAFMDGRLGHEKQTRGLLRALSARTAVQVAHIHLSAPSMLSGIRNAWLSARADVSQRQAGGGRTDLIIGTGARTHIPMLLYQKRSGGRLVTCMTPNIFYRNRFDLCFIPQHDAKRAAENLFVTVGPPGLVEDLKRHDPARGLILVGGLDRKSHHWDSPAIMARIEHIVRRQPHLHWTISSSPRTPEEMILLLDHFFAGGGPISFFRSQDTPDGWIEKAYAENQMVWVTADSISMVYEALAAGCQVGIIPVQWKRRDNKFQRSIDYLAEQQWVVTYDKWLEGLKPAPGAPLNEARRCAEEMLRRWWPERLVPAQGPQIPCERSRLESRDG
jgi:uncharacterized protein